MSDHILALITTQVWQITALAIVVAVVVKLAAKNRPHLAHALWVLVLIKCVTPPLWGHSLGVFSQLQARLMPDEPATLPDVSESPASVPVAIAEALVPAPEIDVPNPQHGQPETFEPDELLSIADTEPPEDASLMWDGGTGFELDEAAQTLDNQEANITYAEPALPVKRFLLSGLVAGAVLTLFVMVIRCLRCLREIHRHRTTEFDVQLRERIQHLSRQLRIRRIPQIIVSDVLFGPAVLGLLRHTIVLPRCLFEIAEGSQGRSFLPERTVFGRSFLPERTFAVRRTAQGATSAPRQSIVIESISSGRVAAGREVLPGREDQHYLDPILAHELLHIRRGDLRTGTLQAIVQSLWWFHPAVWLSNRWLSREAERCCDEQVIAELGCSPARYARSLLSVIECKHQLQPIPVFPGMKPVEITTQRMERIMSLKNGLKKRTPLWCWLTVVGLALVVLPGAVAIPSADEVAPKDTNGDTLPREKDDVGTDLPEFDGNMFWSDTDLRKHLSKRERAEDIESATTLDADCESIKLKYREVGFFDVEVKALTSSVDDPGNHTVRFEIKEGMRYTIREVRFEGNNRISASDLQQGSILKRGDKYSAFRTSKDIERIRELYKGLSLEPATIDPVPHFSEESGVIDVVYEIDEGLTTLIRLDESLIPSPDKVLTGDTVLAYVADKKITLAQVLIGALSQLDKDRKLTPDQRQRVLRAGVEQRLPAYLYDEIVLHEYQRTIPAEQQIAMRNSLELPFNDVLKKMIEHRKAKDLNELERMLLAEGISMEYLHEAFVRQQLAAGYLQFRSAGSAIRDRAAIEGHCRQLLFEARLRQKVSLNADDSWLPSELICLEEKCGIRISRNAIYEVDRSVTVTAHLLDQPLLDVIKAIVEPNGFQVAVGQEEVLITAKTKDQPVVETSEPVSLRIPVLPIPEFVNKSSDPLVKLVWDAREASRRRLLMSDQRTPWQFMNGLAALRHDFLIRTGDEAMAGLDWVQNGKDIPGDPWFRKTEHGGQPDPQPAPIWFDDHAQQFIATLAMNNVPIDAKFSTADGTITMGDMIKHLQMTVTQKYVPPWTLIALARYLPPDAEWVKKNGDRWSIERVLKRVIDGPSAETYTTSLTAIAFARDQYLLTRRPLQGVWLEAQDKLGDVIQQTESRSIAAGDIRPVSFRSPRLPHRTFGLVKLRSPTFPVSQRDVEARRYIGSVGLPEVHKSAASYDFNKTPGREMLLFCVAALPDRQLQEDWLRNAIEVAANELLADWANAEIRSPFYETTQALSIYLERIAVADAATTVDQTSPFTVQVKGRVRIPGIYKASTGDNLRVTDAIGLAGGTTDEAAKTVYVIRNPRKNQKSTILQIEYNGAKRGAEPNIFLAPGDEVLLQSPEIVKTPIADSIRLDDSFVMSPDMPITGSSVIVYVNDRPITVERFIGSLWNRLEETPEITETLKRRVALEAIASGLPEFVFQQLIENYFDVDTAERLEDDSMPLREVTDKQFAEILEKASKFDADPRMQARTLLALRARDSRVEFLLRQQREFVRGMHNDSVGNNKAIVIKYVQELLTTACLRNAVSLDFTNSSLSDVVQVLEKDQYINVEINSLHAQIGSRIFDKPATVEFHCKNKLLGDAIKDIVEQFGMTTHLHGNSVLLQFADSQQAMEKFRSLPGPPSFGLFGIVQNNGWHPLKTEIRLLDALGIAGRVENPEGVTIEITNPDIIVGNAIPVSMSLGVLQNDESGKLNRIVKDGDMITVTRNGFADALPIKLSGAGVINGKGVNNDSGIVATARFDQRSDDVPEKEVGLLSIAKEPVAAEAEARLVLCTYPVADLVVHQQSVMAAVNRTTGNGNLTTRDVVPPAAAAEASDDSADRAIPQPLPEAQDSTAMPLSDKADFAPLTELIKATVQPDSWDARNTIAVEEKLLSLVIRQTEAAHGEIADLLSQLRNAQDQNVRIQCLLLQLTEESQKQRVREKCSLHPAESDRQWALLPPQRSQALTQTLLELKPEVLQRPQVMTISGQTATIQIGSIVAGENAATGIRLAMTPHLLPDSKVIRMQHSFLVGGFANEMPKPIESLVGSGQTLLLLIDDPEDRENPDAARSQYLLMMTPVHIPQKEEEWDVSGGASEDSAFAVDPADSPVK